ncbi:glycosyltransferase [Nostoc sp. GT001]|uniref:glycosyltransferase n=1 Tax=Nostoc sp. GT001 TaxID=3056647 RepID=UPI0025AB4F88|nr:glycosyltransferase [Nostoc sp. GT001]MDM9582399.1 glycosyltransferase [Nostoc sp. GT001]
MKTVGMYRRAYPRVSETFIGEQAHNLQTYKPLFLTCKLLEEIPFDNIAISDNDQWKIKQLFHIISASPDMFGKESELKNLKLIHGHFGPDGIYAMRLAEKLNIPFIVTFYGFDITVSRRAMWLSGNPAFYQFLLHEEELKQKASKFIAFSSFLYKKMIEYGYPEDKIIKLNSGIDLEKFAPASESKGERYILCVGRHTEKKGIDTLLKAFARIASKHPDVSVIQIGNGTMTEKFKTLADELGISNRVNFMGAKPYEVIQKTMRNAEIFSLPSQTAKNGDSEGLPLSILEAAASGLPIASTWHSAIPDAILDGETGFLVDEKDDQALAEKLDILLSDRALAKSMGEKGREFICENFDIRKQTAKLEAIYDLVIS